jgi:hypothetical protein
VKPVGVSAPILPIPLSLLPPRQSAPATNP